MKSFAELSLKESEKKALQKLKYKLSARFPQVEIIIYGSKARGDYDKSSDIDLLILLEHDVTSAIEKEIIGLAYDIELEHNIVFGLLIESKNSWDSSLSRAMPIHWNIEKEGVTL